MTLATVDMSASCGVEARIRQQQQQAIKALSISSAIEAATEEAGALAVRHFGVWGARDISSPAMTAAGPQGPAKWSLPDATQTPLPPIPSLRIFSIYGVQI